MNKAGELKQHTAPAISTFTIGGSCKIYRYTFDAAGNLTKQTDTGETAAYRR